MNKFTDREINLLINSTHERAMRLLDMFNMFNAMSEKGFNDQFGNTPTVDDVNKAFEGHKDHLALVDKLRSLRNL